MLCLFSQKPFNQRSYEEQKKLFLTILILFYTFNKLIFLNLVFLFYKTMASAFKKIARQKLDLDRHQGIDDSGPIVKPSSRGLHEENEVSDVDSELDLDTVPKQVSRIKTKKTLY